jgi:hypothetical protein
VTPWGFESPLPHQFGSIRSPLAVAAGYGVFAAAVRRHVIKRPQVVAWMRRGFAVCSVALRAQLARTTRD